MRIVTKKVRERSKQGSPSASATTLQASVENQVDLSVYSVHDDYAEMVTQFGYVCLFSTAWPLIAVSQRSISGIIHQLFAFINNWIELRSDVAKIAHNVRRPFSERTESIGPWLSSMRVLAWLGAISNTLWILMFRNCDLKMARDSFFPDDPSFTPLQGVLILVAIEHAYFLLAFIVREALNTIPRPALALKKEKDQQIKAKYVSAAKQLLDTPLIAAKDASSYLDELNALLH
jgi:hypothetical protein